MHTKELCFESWESSFSSQLEQQGPTLMKRGGNGHGQSWFLAFSVGGDDMDVTQKNKRDGTEVTERSKSVINVIIKVVKNLEKVNNSFLILPQLLYVFFYLCFLFLVFSQFFALFSLYNFKCIPKYALFCPLRRLLLIFFNTLVIEMCSIFPSKTRIAISMLQVL